jgi:predicted esterase
MHRRDIVYAREVMKAIGFFVAAMLLALPVAADEPVALPADAVVHLAVTGNADSFVIEPKTTDPRPIVMILHARNGDPEFDCQKWSDVASPFGWVLCPSGPVAAERGRSWGKLDEAKKAIDASVDALRAKFGARVKSTGNVIIGFSEGALVAQVLGIQQPERWNRWMILAGSDRYWGDRAPEILRAQRRKIARVVMLTGEHDPIVENTLRAGGMVRAAGIPVRVIVRRGLGHEVPGDRMIANYRRLLQWLVEGT